MAILKIESFEIKVCDFMTTETSYIFDLKFDSFEQSKSFNEFYRKNYAKQLKFSCAETNAVGYLGFFIYDSKCNSRLYITDEPSGMIQQKRILNYNLVPLLRNYEKRFSLIIDALKKNGIFSEGEVSHISFELNPLDADLEFQIEDVHKYLVKNKSTIQETRDFFKSVQKDSSL